MIKPILTATSLLISGIAFADVPNTFEAGSVIKASEMNENFTSIDSKVEALDSRTENVSDLEVKVANLEGQVETLQSLVNSVAETASTDVEFVGYTAAEVFGSIGLQAGRTSCSNIYPGSQICSEDNIRNLNNWSSFTSGYPLFLMLLGEGEGSDANLCYDYSSRSGSVSFGYIEEGKLFFGSPSYRTQNSIRPDTQSNVYNWIISYLPETLDGGNMSKPENENSYYLFTNYEPDVARFNNCNTSLPAACCK